MPDLLSGFSSCGGGLASSKLWCQHPEKQILRSAEESRSVQDDTVFIGFWTFASTDTQDDCFVAVDGEPAGADSARNCSMVSRSRVFSSSVCRIVSPAVEIGSPTISVISPG